MQRVARSIVSDRKIEDAASAESMQTQSENSQKNNQNAHVRRRGGRRVVRGAGAADANVPVQVETEVSGQSETETEKVLASKEPASSVHDTRRRVKRKGMSVSDENKIQGEQEPQSRRRRKRINDSHDESVSNEDDAVTNTRRRSTRTRSRKTSTDSQSVNSKESEKQKTQSKTRKPDKAEVSVSRTTPTRPMTSLLFQEPIIPTRSHSVSEGKDQETEPQESEESATNRRTSSRKSKTRKTAKTSSSAKKEEIQVEETQSQEQTEEPRRRRSRRLNAQERQAADEVGKIEDDLQSDGIVFFDEDTEDDAGDSDGNEDNTRIRRRRKSVDDEEDVTLTRRRRRRRGAKDTEEEAEPRSRRQQYVDEITGIEGSTRLEAKKQRRRDNRRERSRQTHLVEQDFLARRENVDRLMVVRGKDKHTQISVIEDGILVEHYVSDIDEVSSLGNIYLGRIQNVLPSMEAAFVDIGHSRNGVLYAGEVNWDTTRLDGQPRRIELAFKSGDPVLVQVTKDPIGHKGARLTSQVTLAGRFLVLVPSGGMTGVSRKLSDHERSRLKSIVAKIAPKDMGVIIRTAADGASEEALQKDLESLERQWKLLEAKRDEFWHGKRAKLLQGEPDVAIRVVRDIFNDDFNQLMVQGDRVYEHIENYLDTMAPDLKSKLVKWDPEEHAGKDVFDKWQIDSQLRKGMERQVYLPSGGSLVIDRTEAMTTIDVNTGRYIGKGKSLEETVTHCNLEAAEEIARQLRLRDIGGMVMIDFVDMVMPANRDLVLRRLLECLSRDRTKHQVAEVTSLGLVQMTRKRVGQGLVEAFSEECPTCRGRGFILHDEPTISSKFEDPYAVKGGDPFVKTSKRSGASKSEKEAALPQGSSPDVKAKLAQIAAAAEKASDGNDEAELEDTHHQIDASEPNASEDFETVNLAGSDEAEPDVVEES